MSEHMATFKQLSVGKKKCFLAPDGVATASTRMFYLNHARQPNLYSLAKSGVG